MSRKGVIPKEWRLSRRLYRETAPNRAVRLAEERMFRARPKLVRPTEVSAKVQNHSADHASRPGKLKPAVGHATPPRQPRTTKAREPGSKPRGRATRSRTAPNAPSDPGERPRPAERFHRPNYPSTTPTDRESVRPRPFRLGHNPIVRPIVPHDRPNAAVDPKPFLKPKLMFSSPA
ncbi:unnamed protein product [Microthlaspi erraticum]|uniref:Uncharacterized protein n=1 Tax=Microthlaspi erraticum TaxID=1685480 RepID=A0A6D2J485_9BRAS|nr:unnamed protein product [Microthlaspi erraticum]